MKTDLEKNAAMSDDNESDYDPERDRARRRRTVRALGVDSNMIGDLHSGLARAIAEGLRAYERELDTEDRDVVDLATDFLDAALEGSARFWEELARTARKVSARRKSEREAPSRRGAQEPIDYERLASLVAKELRAQARPTGSANEP